MPHLIPERSFRWILQQLGGTIIAQKDAFLCAAKGVSVGIEFQRRLGTGIFGGEGFIMEKLDGDGMAFMHAGGYVIEKELRPGEILKVDTGCVVAYTPTIDFDIEFVRGIKNFMFGGEGLFFAYYGTRQSMDTIIAYKQTGRSHSRIRNIIIARKKEVCLVVWEIYLMAEDK